MKTRKTFAAMALAAFSLTIATASFGQTATSGAATPAPKPATAVVAKPATAPAKATGTSTAKATKAATDAEPAKVTARSIIGEVVDPGCWIVSGAKGAQHKDCAIACAKAGQVLAIVESKSQKLYMVATDKPGEDPNKGLIDYVGQMVVVKGRVYTRGGATGIKVTSVQPYSATAVAQ